MAYMNVAFVMLTILPSALSASQCEEDGSCPVDAKADSLLQTRGAAGRVSIVQDAEDSPWDNFARYMNYTLAGMGGNSILVHTDGFNGTSSNFDGTMPSCYDACMAQTDPPCLAFTFASPVWHFKENRWCSLHLEVGSMFHRNEFFLGFPNSRRVDLSSDGDFFLQRSGDLDTQTCLTQVNSHFESIACDAANPNQKWHRDQEGIYINSGTGQCIANKDGQIEAVAVPERLAGEPLITCAKKFYTTNHNFFENQLFLEKLDSYDVPDAADEASWDGVSWRKFWESGTVPEFYSKLVVKGSVRTYAEVTTLE